MNTNGSTDSDSQVDERVTEELEALQAILLDEIEVVTNDSGRPISVVAVLLPSTAADEEQQFVTVTLAVDLPPSYPDQSPNIRLRNPRGLSDDLLAKIKTDAQAKCDDYIGQPVLYELIELVKEHLTSSNTPNCHCTICLYGFHQQDEFTKTPCFHYFHAHCLACYIRSCQEEKRAEREKLPLWQRMQDKDQALDDCAVPCPVCREPVNCELDRLSQASPPLEVSAALQFELTDELKLLQRNMAALYMIQQSKGGIIDPEADESKRLLVTQTVTDSTSAVPETVPSSTAATPSAVSQQGYRPQAPGSRSWKQQQRKESQTTPQQQQQQSSTTKSSSKPSGSHHHHQQRRGGGRRERRTQQQTCESTR